MYQQIMQYNRMTQNDTYRQAEKYHNGEKYGEYNRLFQQAQKSLAALFAAGTSLSNRTQKQPAAQASKFTPDTK